MPIEGKINIDQETIVDLPINKVAYFVLKNFSECNSRSLHNWFLGAKREYGDGEHMLALSEAWSWLVSKGMVVKNPDSIDSRSYLLSRTGLKALDNQSFEKILAAEKIELNLHPILNEKIKPIFLMGDYETACFRAMKEVEVRVRELSGLPQDEIGAKLMRKAFNPENGPLTNMSLELGERNARSSLFAGAIGSFKNPTSHRPVTYNDATEASEVIFLADLLLRILEQ